MRIRLDSDDLVEAIEKAIVDRLIGSPVPEGWEWTVNVPGDCKATVVFKKPKAVKS